MSFSEGKLDAKIDNVAISELPCDGEPEAQIRRRVLRKLDLRLLPVASVFYLLAYL